MQESLILTMAKEPKKYNFHGWDTFYPTVLRYHKAKYPDANLVSDRISTFRSYMSPEVINYLGGFTRPHPRFNTTTGWDNWVEDVMDLLRKRDGRVGHAATRFGWLAKFRMGTVSYLELWDGLDMLVVEEEMSNAEQRRVFWDSIPPDLQGRLVAQCPPLDPESEVWKTTETGTAEQEISRTIELLKLEASIISQKAMIKLAIVPIIFGAAFAGSVGWNSFGGNSGFAVLMFFLSFAIGLFTFVGGCFIADSWTQKESQKRSLKSMKHRLQ